MPSGRVVTQTPRPPLPSKKINGGFVVSDGMALGLLVGIKRHCLLLVVLNGWEHQPQSGAKWGLLV